MAANFEAVVLEALAEIKTDMSNVKMLRQEDREAFEQERRESHESRSTMHEKIDLNTAQVATLANDMAIHTQTVSQVREELKAMRPAIASVIAAQTVGKLALWVLGGGLATIVVVGVTVGGLFRQIIAGWLGIH